MPTDTDKTVAFGWIDNGNTTGEFAHSIALAAAYESAHQRFVTIIRFRNGPMMPEGRNKIVQHFLDSPAEWLFMVDSDMVFSYDAVEQLLEHADPISAPFVGGLCFSISDEYGQIPTLYYALGEGVVVMRDLPEAGGMLDVDATGAAFCVMHRSLFEKYRRPGPHPWYHRIEREDAFLGEDISWCLWLKQRHNVPIHVNLDVSAGHVKPTVIGLHNYKKKIVDG